MEKIKTEKSEPLYQQIKNTILSQINNNELKSGDKIPSMIKLAKHFNVSLITIKQAIGELVNEGYLETKGSKGTFVQEKNKERTKHIEIILSDAITNLFFNEILKGIETILRAKDFSISFYNTHGELEREVRYLSGVDTERTDGIILCPSYSGKDSPSIHIIQKLKHRIPIIFLDIKIEGVELDYVRTDNLKGGYEATKYLIEMGHRKIGIILGREVNTTLERLEGYKKALEEYGIEYNELFVKKFHRRSVHEEIGYIEAMELLHLKNPPTAIIVFSDGIAIGVYKAAHKMGLTIPEQLSVVGYDNLPISEYLIPSLTTIHQKKQEMGEECAKLLLSKIEGDTRPPVDIILPPELIIRESCCEVREKVGVRR